MARALHGTGAALRGRHRGGARTSTKGFKGRSIIMKISVIGCGYLGAVHAATLASMGHTVVGIDVDPGKVAQLARGAAPFHEPGLDELLEHGRATGRLHFSTDPADAGDAQVHFL